MQAVDEAKIPRAVLISRMDRENANFCGDRTIARSFSSRYRAVMLPVGEQHDFMGLSTWLAANI